MISVNQLNALDIKTEKQFKKSKQSIFSAEFYEYNFVSAIVSHNRQNEVHYLCIVLMVVDRGNRYCLVFNSIQNIHTK